jgi:hypothetical protein
MKGEVHKKIEDRVQEIFQKKLENLNTIKKEQDGYKIVTNVEGTGTSKQQMGGRDGAQILPKTGSASKWTSNKERPALHEPKDHRKLQEEYAEQLAKTLAEQMTPRSRKTPRAARSSAKKHLTVPEAEGEDGHLDANSPDNSKTQRRTKDVRKNSGRDSRDKEVSQKKEPNAPPVDDPSDLVDKQLDEIQDRVDERDPKLYVDVNIGKKGGDPERIVVYEGDTAE